MNIKELVKIIPIIIIMGCQTLEVNDTLPEINNQNLYSYKENRIWYEKDMEVGAAEEEEDAQVTEATVGRQELNIPAEVHISEIWTRSEGEYSDDQHRIWISSKGYMDQTVLHVTDDDDNVISLHFSPFLDNVRLYDEYTQAQ